MAGATVRVVRPVVLGDGAIPSSAKHKIDEGQDPVVADDGDDEADEVESDVRAPAEEPQEAPSARVPGKPATML